MNSGIYLLLGTNMGDRLLHLQQAGSKIADFATINRVSAVYKTAAWGKTDQPDFFNQVLEISTPLDPWALMEKLLEVEKTLGRERIEKWGPRIIDIDILLFAQRKIESDNLTIPHPQLPNRRFALEPLYEISPAFIHPVTGMTIAELLNQCADSLTVEKLA